MKNLSLMDGECRKLTSKPPQQKMVVMFIFEDVTNIRSELSTEDINFLIIDFPQFCLHYFSTVLKARKKLTILYYAGTVFTILKNSKKYII